jgi:hypothetical protein
MVCKKCGNTQDLPYNKNLFDYQNSLEKSKNVIIDRLDVIAAIEGCEYCK